LRARLGRCPEASPPICTMANALGSGTTSREKLRFNCSPIDAFEGPSAARDSRTAAQFMIWQPGTKIGPQSQEEFFSSSPQGRSDAGADRPVTRYGCRQARTRGVTEFLLSSLHSLRFLVGAGNGAVPSSISRPYSLFSAISPSRQPRKPSRSLDSPVRASRGDRRTPSVHVSLSSGRRSRCPCSRLCAAGPVIDSHDEIEVALRIVAHDQTQRGLLPGGTSRSGQYAAGVPIERVGHQHVLAVLPLGRRPGSMSVPHLDTLQPGANLRWPGPGSSRRDSDSRHLLRVNRLSAIGPGPSSVRACSADRRVGMTKNSSPSPFFSTEPP